MVDPLPWTHDDAANELLASNPTALIIGMLLDQQFPMERAFFSPHLLQERMGVPIDPAAVAELDPERLESIFKGPPALHRFPGSMGSRAQALCQVIVDEYGGDTPSIWRTAGDGAELYRRLRALPGFGEAKARIFVGVIGKRLGEGPDGWENEAADWASIADVDSFEKVTELREAKRAAKAAAKKD